MDVDVCLIQTPVPELQEDRLDPPMGLLYLASTLKWNGIDVQILDLSGVPAADWRFPEAKWYGFSTYTASYNRTLRIKDMVKKLYPSCKTIAGGPHASALPGIVRSEFDHVICGEGEGPLLRIVMELGPRSSSYFETHDRDIDTIPMPDYSLVDVGSYTRRYLGRRSFQVFTSRGCPFSCGFCSKLPGARVHRRRSVDNVVREINSIREKYGDVSFRFKDDLFAGNHLWLNSFRSRELGIEYSCNVRADYSASIPDHLAATGCKTACIGIESGSDTVLKSMGKGVTRQQNIDGIRGLQAVGIDVLAWIMIGYPGETWETFYETISLLEEAQPEIVRAYPLIPYPGTPVYDQVEILDKDWDHYFYIRGNNETGFVYQTPELPRGEIKGMWAALNRYLEKYRTRVEGS